MSITRANFGELLEPGLRKVLDDERKLYNPMLGELFNVNSSSKDSERDVPTTGIGYMSEKKEDNPVAYESPLQGYPTNYVHKTYAKGIKVSYEMVADDQYRVVDKNFRRLAKSAVRTPDKDGFGVLRNAFDTSATSYGDAKPLCSTLHSRRDGGTAQSNASSSGIILNEGNLETGLLGLSNVLDDKGQLIDIANAGNVMLVVPKALRKTALEITGSALRSGTTDNDLNVYKGDIDVMVNPWIDALAGGSDTAWYLVAKGEHELNWFWREKPNMDREKDFETKQEKFDILGRWSFGWSDWRGTWGSKGDEISYSS